MSRVEGWRGERWRIPKLVVIAIEVTSQTMSEDNGLNMNFQKKLLEVAHEGCTRTTLMKRMPNASGFPTLQKEKGSLIFIIFP